MLFDAIDSLLNSQILNFTGRNIVKDFSKTKAHYKIQKQEFRNLFNTLLGTSFNKALESIPYDRTMLQIERADDSVLPTIPVLTSTPVKDEDESIEPNFKAQYSKIKRLHDNSEDEIRYRDNIIEQLEKREIGSRDKDSQIKSLNKKLDDLEEDVVYRDKIIIDRDNELKLKDEKLRRLQDRLKLMEDEVKLYRDNDDKVVVKHNEFFNKALMERAQEQQRAIGALKNALAEKANIVSKNPIIISSPSKASSKNSASSSWRNVIYSILVLILLFFILKPKSGFKSQPWYINTFLEPFFYHLFEDTEIDYDYYNLGDVDFDFLQT